MFNVWQKVASYSEYLVEVVFLRIYTHINIYCKFISFFSFFWFVWGFDNDNMHGFFSWVTLLISWANQEDLQKCNVKFSSFFFFCLLPVCPVLCFPRLFMPANTLYLYISFFISVTVICTSSLDALTMQNPFFHSITCTVFSTRHHNCLLPQKNSWETLRGMTSTKKKKLTRDSFWRFKKGEKKKKPDWEYKQP